MKKVVGTQLKDGILWNIIEENEMYECEIYKEDSGTFIELYRKDGFSERDEANRHIKEFLKKYAKAE